MDRPGAVRKGGESVAIIVSNAPDDSALLKRVTAADDSRMPPPDEGTGLTADDISLRRRWIEQGAVGPDDERPQIDPDEHWSHQPATRPGAIPPPIGVSVRARTWSWFSIAITTS